jgi:hypothetical protein
MTWIFFETTLVIGLSVAASLAVAVYFLWGSKPGRAKEIKFKKTCPPPDN